VSEELSTQPVDTRPSSVTVGNAKIIADPRANTIIMLGNKDVVVKCQKILDELDVKAPQVALSTVIGELTLSENEEFGVDWFLRFRNKGGLNGVVTNRNTGAPLPSPASSAPIPLLDPGQILNFQQIATAAGS